MESGAETLRLIIYKVPQRRTVSIDVVRAPPYARQQAHSASTQQWGHTTTRQQPKRYIYKQTHGRKRALLLAPCSDVHAPLHARQQTNSAPKQQLGDITPQDNIHNKHRAAVATRNGWETPWEQPRSPNRKQAASCYQPQRYWKCVFQCNIVHVNNIHICFDQ